MKIERGAPRYRAVVDKRFNKRFRASPDYVRLVDSTEHVRVAIEEAVREGRRVVVTIGAHSGGSTFDIRADFPTAGPPAGSPT